MERVFSLTPCLLVVIFFIHHHTLLHSTIGHTFNNVFLGKEVTENDRNNRNR